MPSQSRTNLLIGFSMIIGLCQLSCRKMVTVPQPINSITTPQMFESDDQAKTAMAGVYTLMINGGLNFSNGYTTLLTGMSSDELLYYGAGDAHILSFNPNRLLYNNSYTSAVWTNAYKTIYNANAVIEGIAASTSYTLTDPVRKRLTAEAQFIRAFCYFYLANLYGDVPLVLTVDFNKTRYMTRTPVSQVYGQIIKDLTAAQSVLEPEPAAERITPGKWAATAMLARVYLYTRDYSNAAAQATAVIDNASLFGLESDPNNVFLIASKEAIWQLKQGIADPTYLNMTTEAYNLWPAPWPNGTTRYCLTESLLNAFEPGDSRRNAWLNSSTNNGAGLYYYPYKYKLGRHNGAQNVASTEYYMVLRLAEMYLIRAEAAANGAAGGAAAAISDLNVIRTRAGLTALPASLTDGQVMAAIAQERRVELFAEWGHRWLDLKRTGKAHDVLSAMPAKQPWEGDYQLLYPIPDKEIQINPRLQQNPDYLN